MNAVVTNTTLLNTGDAAILFATVGILRQALGDELHVTACDQQAEVTRRLYPALDIQPTVFSALGDEAARGGRRHGSMRMRLLRTLVAARLWRTRAGPLCERFLPTSVCDALDRIAGARVVVAAGGTYLVPHYRLLPNLTDLLCAHAMGRPFILFTQSLGPIPGGRDGFLMRYVLRRAKLVLVRDAQSRRYLKEMRVREDRIIECADAAFALPPFENGAEPSRPDHNRRLHVAISVRDWPHVRTPGGMDGYRAALTALTVDLLVRHKAHVTFISTCQGVSDYWTDDSETAAGIVAGLAPELRDKVWVDRDFHTPWQMMSLLGRFDAVVATRMHVAILALLAGVPVLPIAYEFKTSELFANLGLGGLVQQMETVTPEGLCAAFDHFLNVRRDLAAIIPGLVEKQRRGAMAAAVHVKEALAVTS